jgi:hypothetical protein
LFDNEIKIPSPTRRKEHELYYCHWCEKLCKGERGLRIHLGKSRGDKKHPEHASIEDDQYSIIPADEDWHPLMDKKDIEFLSKRWSSQHDGLSVGPDSPTEPIEPGEYNLPDAPKGRAGGRSTGAGAGPVP